MVSEPMLHDLPEDLAHLAGRLASRAAGGDTARGAEVHAELASTNDRALDLAAAGAAHGQVVVADRQTAGRGRRGRSWVSGPQEGLLLSIVVRVGNCDPAWGWLPLAAGLATQRALVRILGAGRVNVGLKWPNDVLADGRKVAGILVERRVSSPSDDQTAVVGVGVNVNADSFPSTVRQPATSLRLLTGTMHDRGALAVDLVSELDRVFAAWMRNDRELRADYVRALVGMGRPVAVRPFDGAEAVRGELVGVDRQGCLVVRCRDGDRIFAAGDVTLEAS